jgi:hypothetical protein
MTWTPAPGGACSRSRIFRFGCQLASECEFRTRFPLLVRRAGSAAEASVRPLAGAWCGPATTIGGSITYLGFASTLGAMPIHELA